MARRYYNTDATPDNFRALWDQIHRLGDQLVSAQATLADQDDTISTLRSDLSVARRRADEALLSVGQVIAATPSPVTSPGGSGGIEGGVDDGLGAQGCATAGADGHVAPGSPLTAITAGQIICGTAKEWSALRAVTIDLPTRQANAEELLLRIIWHLNLAGFTAGRQKNPSGVISTDKLTVQIDGVFRAYDVFIGYDDFTMIMQTYVGQVFPASYIAEAGTAD